VELDYTIVEHEYSQQNYLLTNSNIHELWKSISNSITFIFLHLENLNTEPEYNPLLEEIFGDVVLDKTHLDSHSNRQQYLIEREKKNK
jgi:hypothetical protein